MRQIEKLFSKLVLAGFCLLCFALPAASQAVVDKMLVSVSDNVRDELITYSDLMWQLALQPGAIIEQPRKEDLSQTLELLIEQRLIALEAERLPTTAPNEVEVASEIRRIVSQFPSAAAFEARLRLVGFDSTDDPNFRRIIQQRVAIEKYLDFRFRSFVVVTPEDEQEFYKGAFAVRFRQANPGVVLPPIEQVQRRINEELTEIKISADIDSFLEQARSRVVVTTLNPL